MKQRIKSNFVRIPFEEIGIPELELKSKMMLPCWKSQDEHLIKVFDFEEKVELRIEYSLADYVSVMEKEMIYHENEYCPNQMNKDQFVSWALIPHSAEYVNGKIWIALNSGPFIVYIDLNKEEVSVFLDAQVTYQYSSTHMIQDGFLYTSRWKLEEVFSSRKSNEDLYLELIKINVETFEFEILDRILGKDQIHTTCITNDGANLVMVEMNTESNVHSPRIESEELDTKIKILEGGLKKSKCLVYNLELKQVNSYEFDRCPAHIVFGIHDNSIYFSRHEMGINATEDKLDFYSFGPATIVKYEILRNGSLMEVNEASDKDLIRIPGHGIFSYEDKSYLLAPVTPNQIFMIDASSMEIYKKISLSNNIRTIDYSKGPVKYKPMMIDKSPYSVIAEKNSPYVIYSNASSIGIYDFIQDKNIVKKSFIEETPITGCGHASIGL